MYPSPKSCQIEEEAKPEANVTGIAKDAWKSIPTCTVESALPDVAWWNKTKRRRSGRSVTWAYITSAFFFPGAKIVMCRASFRYSQCRIWGNPQVPRISLCCKASVPFFNLALSAPLTRISWLNPQLPACFNRTFLL